MYIISTCVCEVCIRLHPHTCMHTHIYMETTPTSKQHQPYGWFCPPCRPQAWTASGTRLPPAPRGWRGETTAHHLPRGVWDGVWGGLTEARTYLRAAWAGSGRRH